MTSRVISRGCILLAMGACLSGAMPAMGQQELSEEIHLRLARIGTWDGQTEWAELEEPYEDVRQREVPFGQRSYVLAPWRAYMDTRPASSYLEAVGMVFNGVTPQEAPVTAKVMAAAGVRSARMEIGWSSLEYDDESKFTNEAGVRARLAALREAGIRPLILLNGNSKLPVPTRVLSVRLMRDAAVGQREIFIHPDDLTDIEPHRTGLTQQAYQNAFPLIVSMDSASGRCELSAPLRKPVEAGRLTLFRLKYAPFGGTVFEDGTPNPAAEETVQGWLRYVRTITTMARDVLGTEGKPDAGFDLEVWNEYSFGSQFLDQRHYYDPPLKFAEPLRYVGHGREQKGVEVLLPLTVDFVRDPANGLPGVNVVSGFANQRPRDSGTDRWPGQLGFSRHYYTGLERNDADVIRPGREPGKADQPLVDGLLRSRKPEPSLIPIHRMGMAESWHYAYRTEFMTRDIQPFQSPWRGHGRFTHPGDGKPSAVWMTEFNTYRGPWSNYLIKTHGIAKDDPRLVKLMHQVAAKAMLRASVFQTHKGVNLIHYFNAKDSDLTFGILPEAWFDLLATEGFALTDRVQAARGVQIELLERMTTFMRQGEAIDEPRPLEVRRLREHQPRLVFEGDGTEAFPNRYHRHDFACLPYQFAADRFAVGYYVVTRDMVHTWDPQRDILDFTRYLMPDQTFEVTLGNVRGAGARLWIWDPLLDQRLEAEVVDAGQSHLTVRIPTTDYPRFLMIEEAQAGPLVVEPQLAMQADGSAELRFTTSVAGEARVTWGPFPDRVGEGEQALPAGTTHVVRIPDFRQGTAVRVEVSANGLKARWPRWDEDVAGVRWDGVKIAPAQWGDAPALSLPALPAARRASDFTSTLPNGLSWEQQGEADRRLVLPVGDRQVIVTLRLHRGPVNPITPALPELTSLDEHRAEAVTWGGLDGLRVHLHLAAVARPGLQHPRHEVYLAAHRDGIVALSFQGDERTMRETETVRAAIVHGVRFQIDQAGR